LSHPAVKSEKKKKKSRRIRKGKGKGRDTSRLGKGAKSLIFSQAEKGGGPVKTLDCLRDVTKTKARSLKEKGTKSACS